MRIIIASIIFIFFIFTNNALADCTNFQSALEQASKIRKLKILKPVRCQTVSPEKFASIIEKSNDLSLVKLTLEEKVNKMIGLIPINYDFKNCYLKNDLESVMASYIPNQKAVIIPNNSEVSYDLLVHEATHALQDQHFNLSKLSKKTSYSTDAYFSFLALAEGDAEIVQADFLQTQVKKSKTAEFKEPKKVVDSCSIPQSLLFQLDFPYFWGTRYARTLKNINNSFSNYPKYSTQILYPNKKLYFKAPRNQELLKLANSQFNKQINTKAVFEDSLGEYTIRCLLREIVGSRTSVISGHGWAGDKIALYQLRKNKNQHVLSWTINLKNKKEALELFNAFKKSFEIRFDLKFDTDADTLLFGNSYYPKIFLHQKEDKVEMLISDMQ